MNRVVIAMMSDSNAGSELPRRTSASAKLSYCSLVMPMTDAILPRSAAMSSVVMFVAIPRFETVSAKACRESTSIPS